MRLPFNPFNILILMLAALVAVTLACSTTDIIGQRQSGPPTPTSVLFATATPGGRISVWLITPTGQSGSTDSGPGGPTPPGIGKIVGPAATATAAYALMQAATMTAGATIQGPLYQPSDCPDSRGGGPPPPPKPTAFSQYPEAIG